MRLLSQNGFAEACGSTSGTIPSNCCITLFKPNDYIAFSYLPLSLSHSFGFNFKPCLVLSVCFGETQPILVFTDRAAEGVQAAASRSMLRLVVRPVLRSQCWILLT